MFWQAVPTKIYSFNLRYPAKHPWKDEFAQKKDLQIINNMEFWLSSVIMSTTHPTFPKIFLKPHILGGNPLKKPQQNKET